MTFDGVSPGGNGTGAATFDVSRNADASRICSIEMRRRILIGLTRAHVCHGARSLCFGESSSS
ncbi:hypothetical protein EMIT0111MI5_20031 [Burkholderia sp. IT-111MI5]